MIVFDWRRFYDVGFCIKNISKKEEFQRSAVGRYYYASFGTVRSYYEKKYETTIPSRNAHQTLINNLLDSKIQNEREIGRKLGKFRKIRNFADYNPIFYISNVKKAEELYNEIIELLDKLKEDDFD